MKQKFLLGIAVFLIHIIVYCQNPSIGTYTEDAEHVLQNVSKNGLQTRILYDRVFPFTRAFVGRLTNKIHSCTA